MARQGNVESVDAVCNLAHLHAVDSCLYSRSTLLPRMLAGALLLVSVAASATAGAHTHTLSMVASFADISALLSASSLVRASRCGSTCEASFEMPGLNPEDVRWYRPLCARRGLYEVVPLAFSYSHREPSMPNRRLRSQAKLVDVTLVHSTARATQDLAAPAA